MIMVPAGYIFIVIAVAAIGIVIWSRTTNGKNWFL